MGQEMKNESSKQPSQQNIFVNEILEVHKTYFFNEQENSTSEILFFVLEKKIALILMF